MKELSSAAKLLLYSGAAALRLPPPTGPDWPASGDGVQASLDYDFAGGRYFPSLGLTVTRAGAAYVDDNNGVWTAVPANTARISNKGLLVEEARTNGIRNNSMQGAVPGTPGTLPTNWSIGAIPTGINRTVVGVGTQNGIDYIDVNFNGTTTSASIVGFWTEGINVIAAASGQTWTSSIFFSIIQPDPSITLLAQSLCGTNGSSKTETFAALSQIGVSSSPMRSVISATLAVAGTTFVQQRLETNAISSGVPINWTVRIGWPQLEQGSFATSPIRTTGAAATRAADAISLSSPPTFGDFTMFGAGTPNAPNTYATNQRLLEVDDSSTTNRATIGRAGTSGVVFTENISAGVGPSPSVNQLWSQGVFGKVALATSGGAQEAAFNGNTGVNSAARPAGVNTVRVGYNAAGNLFWNGYITRAILWANSKLSHSAMQQLTAQDIPSWLQPIVSAGGSKPDIAFDFIQNAGWLGGPISLDRLLSTTRASVGYADDTSGNWTLFQAGVPRITNKGLLVEEQRINGIRNNSMQGAVPGTPGTLPTNWTQGNAGGLTRQIIGVGTDQGIDYIDFRYSGTSPGGVGPSWFFEGVTQIAAVQNQTWTGSFFVKLVSGTLTNVGQIQSILSERDAGGGLIAVFGSVPMTTITGNWQRVTTTWTLPDATTAFIVSRFDLLNMIAGPVDFTIRIGWPQLEQGVFATSPIRTTNAAVTRNNDAIIVANPPAFGSAYSLFAAGTPVTAVSDAASRGIMQVDNGADANRFTMRKNSTNALATGTLVVGGTGTATLLPGTWVPNALGKMAAAVAANDQAGSFNAGSLATAGGAIPPTPTVVHVGGENSAGATWDGYINQGAIWVGSRLPNPNLTALTQ